jgi:carbon-monoxide dehydrogenase medium subunit
VKAPALEYRRATSVDEALDLLASLGDGAKVLAGGQSLGPMLNYRLVRPSHLIDVRQIEVLGGSGASPDGGGWLGAAVTHSAVEDGRAHDPTGGFLRRVAHGIAYRSIRNRGTLGGSLVHADPAADWPVVMCALDATLKIASHAGGRTIPAHSFFLGQLETALHPDELLVRIDLPRPPPKLHCGFAKFARKAGDFAESIAVAILDQNEDQEIERASIWLGAAGATPLCIAGVERLLVGKRWNRARRVELPGAVAAALPTPESQYERWRHNLHSVLIARAIDDALS